MRGKPITTTPDAARRAAIAGATKIVTEVARWPFVVVSVIRFRRGGAEDEGLFPEKLVDAVQNRFRQKTLADYDPRKHGWNAALDFLVRQEETLDEATFSLGKTMQCYTSNEYLMKTPSKIQYVVHKENKVREWAEFAAAFTYQERSFIAKRTVLAASRVFFRADWENKAIDDEDSWLIVKKMIVGGIRLIDWLIVKTEGLIVKTMETLRRRLTNCKTIDWLGEETMLVKTIKWLIVKTIECLGKKNHCLRNRLIDYEDDDVKFVK